MLEGIVAPTLKKFLDFRMEHDISDEDFFLCFSAAIADMIGIMTEAVIADGREFFVERVLRIVSAVLAHKIGTDVVPDREAILNIIRRTYN